MQPISFQTEKATERKKTVIMVSKAFATISKSKFPAIHSQIKRGNSTKESILNLVIEQMYALNFSLERSLLAVEANI
jgi:hypothetical protein